MDFSRLPSGPARLCAGLAGLLLLLAGTAPGAAETTAQLKSSIDQAGNAVNRQLGDWLGVAPAKPAKRKGAGTPKPMTGAAVPLPPPRPAEAEAALPVEAAPLPPPAPETAAVEPPPAPPEPPASPQLATPAPSFVPMERPSRRPDKVTSAEPPTGVSPDAADEPDLATPDPAAPTAVAAPPAGPDAARVPLPPPPPERQLAALPPPAPPATSPVAPAPDSAQAVPTLCPELADIGVFTPTTVKGASAACTVERAVSLSAVRMKDGRLVTLEPAAVLRCDMAAAVARWLREGVEPAIGTLGAPLDKVLVAASQQCRPRNRVAGAKISEHGRGNALDTRGYVLADGRRFVIGAPGRNSGDTAMPVAFQERLKASACADFTTILGPGSDGYHELHLHVDRAERRNGLVLCRWAVAEVKAAASPLPPKKPEAAPLPPTAPDAPPDGAGTSQ